MKPFIYNAINDSSLITEMNRLLDNTDITESPYSYFGSKVPRVTSILKEMIYSDGLMNWANYIGRAKHMDHNKFSENSANIGTRVHDAIEKYVSTGYVETFSDVDNISDKYKMKNAFMSFKEWWDIISTHDIEVLMQEQPLVCKYYGGTLDMLLKIDGRKFLIDFKTSNHFSYKYHLQTAAYRRSLYTEYGIIVDGILILKLNKEVVCFEEQVIDLTLIQNIQYINDCERFFMSLVYSYYNRFYIETRSKDIFGLRY